jgi:hypothetical protein
MSRTGRILFTASFVLALGSAAAQIFHVPGSFATLNGALAAVPPGAVIVVHGGSHPPITITKAVTLVGSPQALIQNTDVPDPIQPFKVSDAIRLAGTGSGRVTLANLRTQGTANGALFSTAGAGVAGAGFAELHVVDCVIEPAQWISLTGQAQGADGVTVAVPYVLVERSTVIGGLSDTDACDYPLNPSGGAGLRAAGGTVAVLDSTVVGGRGPIMCFSVGNCPSLPLPESDGGPGIVALAVLRAGSAIAGGEGQPVTCGPLVLGTEADGPPIVAGSVTDLGNALTASGPGILGAPWALSWSTTPGPAFLAVGVPSVPPASVGSKGLLFLDADTLLLLAVAGGPGQVLVSVLPAIPSLAGQEVAVQIYDTVIDRLTRPVMAVLQP